MSDFKLNQINLDLLFKEAENFFSEGNFDGSEKILQSILDNYPNHPDALNNIATVLFAQNKKSESVVFLKKLLLQDSENYLIHYRCAIALAELDRLEDAIFHCKEAIKINPEYLEAYEHLANIYEFDGKKNEQKEIYKKIIALDKSHEAAYLNLANLYLNEGKYFDAIILLNEINNLNPNLPAVQCSFGRAYYHLDKFEEAKKHLHLSCKLNQLYSNPIYMLGIIYEAEGHFEKATTHFWKAVKNDELKLNQEKNTRFKSEDTNNHRLALASSLIRKGNYLQGFNFYESRLNIKTSILNIYNLDPDSWENIKPNSSIMILKEQGIADQIYYSRYIDYILKISSKLTICLDERLIPIFKRTYKDKKINFLNSNPDNINSEFDYFIPLASLPKINLKNEINLNEIRPTNLIVSDEIVISQPFKSSPVFGISWRSKSIMMGERSSIKLEEFLEIFEDIHITIINLQYGELTKDEISTLTKFKNITFLDYSEIDKFQEIDKLISLMHICDYVVTIDNITAHLAGSIGIPCCVLLPKTADFRWGLSSKNKRLYPSLKLFRNKRFDDWTDLIKDINQYIKNLNKVRDSV
ncbi:tetratricopeptide repeat protein [Candidatus Methylopumilus planktonicus]|uniref:tetratricopeptide repeat protein n=1 Tax=Candidatus Methylopumilus planktonicus TaxID=1581557 RepID=UPI003BEED0EF